MKTSRLFVCVATALLMTACARDPKPGTSEAAAMGERYMRSMSDTMARAHTFSFATDEQLEVLTPGGEKRSLHLARQVTVRRPDAVVFKLDGKEDTAPDILAYYDGKTATLSNTKNGVWAQTVVPGTLDEMLNDLARRFGLPVPIGDVMYSSPYDAFLGKSSKGGFVGRETVEGVSCAVVDYADDLVGVRLWIPSSGPPMPRRLQITYKQVPVPLASTIDFTNWKLDVPVSDATFAFQPPANSNTIAFADFVAAMYGGTAASFGATETNAPVTPAAR